MTKFQRLVEWAEESRIGHLRRRDFLLRVLLIGGSIPAALALPKESEAPPSALEGSANRGSSTLRCAFCDKEQREVWQLITGPSVCICITCVEVCNEYIAEEQKFRARAGALASAR